MVEEKEPYRFSVAAEILPRNEKTEEILKMRAAQEAAEREKAAALDAAKKRQRDEEKRKANNQANLALQKKQQEEQKLLQLKKQEEESKRLGGRMLNMLRKLQKDETHRDMTASGVELGTIRARILISNIRLNTSLYCMSMTRQLIEDEVGVDLAKMLLLNKTIRKFDLEGNKLGPKTAREFAHVLRYNTTLRYLDFENNMLTTDGEDITGLLAFIEALKYNKTLLSLNIANNRLDDQIGRKIAESLAENSTLIDLEVGFNSFDVDTTRQIQTYLRRNKAIFDENQLREWKERCLMRDEDKALQQKYLSEQTTKERVRMEEEAFEQKEKEIAEEWRQKQLDFSIERMNLIQQLTESAIIRGSRGKRKGKKRGGKKKKK